MTSDGGYIERSQFSFERDFTQLKNRWLRDPNLSYRARGIFAYLFSMPPKTKVSLEALAKNVSGVDLPGKRRKTGEGIDAIREAIKELEAIGYLVRTTSRHYGRFKVEWLIQDPDTMLVGLFAEDEACGNTALENPMSVDNLPVDNPATALENPTPTALENPTLSINTIKNINNLTRSTTTDRAREPRAVDSYGYIEPLEALRAPGCHHRYSLSDETRCLYFCSDNQPAWTELHPGEDYPTPRHLTPRKAKA